MQRIFYLTCLIIWIPRIFHSNQLCPNTIITHHNSSNQTILMLDQLLCAMQTLYLYNISKINIVRHCPPQMNKIKALITLSKIWINKPVILKFRSINRLVGLQPLTITIKKDSQAQESHNLNKSQILTIQGSKNILVN